MPQIITRKTIFINGSLNAANTFTADINDVTFVPSQVIVRQVSVVTAASVSNFFSCKSDLVSNYTLFSGFAGAAAGAAWNQELSTPFDLHKPVQGKFTFTLYNDTGALASITGNIGLVLEFIQEKQPKH